ncbi:Glycoside hydrolase, family 28 [Pelomyxa schiedti]|nr:Glycoside hydrolase, family 28 [Pelomyxa schiedti]
MACGVWLCVLVVVSLSIKYSQSKDFYITDFGAIADCATPCTDAIADAVAAAASNDGGGRVVVPATPGSCFLSGAFNLTSDVWLYLSEGALLRASDDPTLYPCMQSVTWDTGICDFPFIGALNATNTGILGKGMIDAGANSPPGHLVDHYDETYNYLYPIDWAFLYPCSSFSCRPKLAVFKDCSNVLLQSVSLFNSPFWTLTLVHAQNATLDGVTIYGDRRWPNNDGVDLVDCNNVEIKNCHITTGDDSVCVVAHTPVPSGNIWVHDSYFESTSAALKVAVFDDLATAVISGVVFDHCVINDTNRGLAVQPRLGTAPIINVTFSNIDIQTKFFSSAWWGSAEPISVVSLSWDTTRPYTGYVESVRFINITAKSENGIAVYGREVPIRQLEMLNVDITIGVWGNVSRPCHDWRPAPPPDMPYAPIDAFYVDNVFYGAILASEGLYLAPEQPFYGKCTNFSNVEKMEVTSRGVCPSSEVSVRTCMPEVASTNSKVVIVSGMKGLHHLHRRPSVPAVVHAQGPPGYLAGVVHRAVARVVREGRHGVAFHLAKGECRAGQGARGEVHDVALGGGRAAGLAEDDRGAPGGVEEPPGDEEAPGGGRVGPLQGAGGDERASVEGRGEVDGDDEPAREHDGELVGGGGGGPAPAGEGAGEVRGHGAVVRVVAGQADVDGVALEEARGGPDVQGQGSCGAVAAAIHGADGHGPPVIQPGVEHRGVHPLPAPYVVHHGARQRPNKVEPAENNPGLRLRAQALEHEGAQAVAAAAAGRRGGRRQPGAPKVLRSGVDVEQAADQPQRRRGGEHKRVQGAVDGVAGPAVGAERHDAGLADDPQAADVVQKCGRQHVGRAGRAAARQDSAPNSHKLMLRINGLYNRKHQNKQRFALPGDQIIDCSVKEAPMAAHRGMSSNIVTGTATSSAATMSVTSCGMLLVRRRGIKTEALILGKTGGRGADLPKGHMEHGETELQTAMREVREETGIDTSTITVAPEFQYKTVYYPQYRRLGGATVEKTLIIFLGFVPDTCECTAKAVKSEHYCHIWTSLTPPTSFGKAVDPVLKAARDYIAKHP